MPAPPAPWYLFDRVREPAAHPWRATLGGLAESPFPENRALGENWTMDHRVSEAREATLLASGYFPDDGAADFLQAVRDWFDARLCVPLSQPPAYLELINASNRIPADTVAPDHPLVHLAAVRPLLRRTLGSFDLRDRLLELTGGLPPEPDKLTPAAIGQLCNALTASGADAVRAFAEAVSDALGEREPHWWAAFAPEVDRLLDGPDWTDAARILGLGHLESGDWLVAWRYPAELAGPLFRPTVAEAGTYGYHFPSPPGELFGVTMPLTPGLAAVKEVIHGPLKGADSESACIGRLGQIQQNLVTDATPPDRDWLRRRRRTHAQRLRVDYAQGMALRWLSRHRLIE